MGGTSGMCSRSIFTVAALVIATAVSAARPSASFAQEGELPQARAASRPTIGLALGGGAARGLAHIGLLRWFEEHRIPVDYLAGTSMGALVAAAYATGLSPDEIQALMRETDWDLAFLADSPFTFKTFRRKEDARAFPGQLDFGLKGGFKVPSSLNSGQQIELLLDRIALPYFGLENFDALPIPFRCVATDIRLAQPVVLDSGSLSDALRASMAMPGLFSPVALDGRLLVDGGALNNVPADVVRAMGARVVIAVNVGSSTDAPPAPTTLFGVLDQTIDAMMTSSTREALKAADLVIVPDLEGLSASDWRRTDELVIQGYKAAEAVADGLLKYQVAEASYAAWMRARQARRRSAVPVVQRVRLEGTTAVETDVIGDLLGARQAGKPIVREAIENSILRMSGTDRYDVVKYFLEAEPDGTELVVRVTPKTHGPPFLMAALDLQNIDANTFAVSVRSRLTLLDSPLPNSEIRIDAGVGTDQTAAGELYKRFGRSGFFAAPRASFTRRSLHWYDEGEFIADYQVKRTGIAFDLGHATGLRSELRLGFDVADVKARLRIGERALPDASGTDRVFSLRWAFDGQDSPVVPTRGVRVHTALRYFIDTPEIVVGEDIALQGTRDVRQAEATGSWFTRVGTRHRLFVSGGGGTSFGRSAGFNEFRLGGPLRLGALNTDEIRGNQYVLGVAGVLREWLRLPSGLGGNAYIGGWLEQGTAFDRWRDAEYKASVSVGVLLETMIGPAFVAYSQSVTGGVRVYTSVGSFLR
ncbi:MAG: rssA 2 [Acidobacteria bacterium]|nr:rssA 2 [Acidobacteriota bacterium]